VHDILSGVLDLAGLLLWLPRALGRLRRWLTEKRALTHAVLANTEEMAKIRFVARPALGLWLANALAAAIQWADPWLDSWASFTLGLAGFIAGPVLLILAINAWRDRVVHAVTPPSLP
jgi:hypothetical protein